MNIEKLLAHPRAIRAVTSLDAAEFEQLVSPFEREWRKFQRRSLTRRGTERLRALGAGRKGQSWRPLNTFELESESGSAYTYPRCK